MSIPPPDQPTEPLRPAPAPYEERVVTTPAVDASVVLLRVEDALASLRTGLMVVGVIAVAALGVAIYASMKDDNGGAGSSRSGLASDSRVTQISDRVDRLSRQVQARSGSAGSGDTAALGDRVGALEKTVATLADRPVPGDATAAVKDLSKRIDAVTSDVEQLKSAQTTP